MIFLQKRATAGTNLTALWGFDTRDYSHPSALGDFVGTLSPFDLNSSPFGGDTNYVTGSYAGTATDWGAILGAVNTEDFAPVLVMAWSDRVSGDADYVQAAMTARQTNGGSPDPSYLGLITMTPSDTFEAFFTMSHRLGGATTRAGVYTYPSTPASGIAIMWTNGQAGTAGLYVNGNVGTYDNGTLPDGAWMDDWGAQADTASIDTTWGGTGVNEILSVEDETTPTPANQQWHVAGFALCHGTVLDAAAETTYWADFFGVTVS